MPETMEAAIEMQKAGTSEPQKDLFAEIGSKIADTIETDASAGEDAQDEATGQEGDSTAEQEAEQEAEHKAEQEAETEEQDSGTAEQLPESERLEMELEEIKSLKEEFNYKGTLAEFVNALADFHDASSTQVPETQPVAQAQETPAAPKKDMKALMAEIEDEDPTVVANKKIAILMDEIEDLQKTTGRVSAHVASTQQAEVQAVVDRFEANFDTAVAGLGEQMVTLLGKDSSRSLSRDSKEFKKRARLYKGVGLKADAYFKEHQALPTGATLQEIVTQEARGLFYDDLHKADQKSLGKKLDKRAAQASPKGDHAVGGKANEKAIALAGIRKVLEKT